MIRFSRIACSQIRRLKNRGDEEQLYSLDGLLTEIRDSGDRESPGKRFKDLDSGDPHEGLIVRAFSQTFDKLGQKADEYKFHWNDEPIRLLGNDAIHVICYHSASRTIMSISTLPKLTP
jgi:hypothetical protein